MLEISVKYLAWQRGIAYYHRKIPIDLRFHYSTDGSREKIFKSLKTSDPRTAVKKRDQFHVELELEFDYIREHGRAPDILDAHEKRTQLAVQMGFDYKPMSEVAECPVEELHSRLICATDQTEALSSGVAVVRASAVLGSEDLPEMRLSDMWGRYAKLVRDKIRHKSEQQLRIWTHARKRAINNLISVIGDRNVVDVTRQDALNFREWWNDRVDAGEVKENTANKDFENLRAMTQKLIDDLALNIANQWRGIRIEPDDRQKRRSLTRQEILDHIFEGNPLMSMNPECRAIVEICAELGTRPIEIINREPGDIVLDDPIPHVKIRRNKYGKLKTKVSERDLPLVGAALRAFKKFPNGFPRYAGNSAGCITAINKYFRENNILPERATFYSLRHGFKDRLRAVDASDDLMKSLMGHSRGHIDYGEGTELEHRLRWLLKIVLQP